MPEPYPTLENIGIPSTGDPERDRQEAERAVLHEKRLIEGVCPNGCRGGRLANLDPWRRRCPKCGFRQGMNRPTFEPPYHPDPDDPAETREEQC